MSANPTAINPTWTVTCEDGQVRHPEPFATRQGAAHFAHWGHCCTARHTIAPTPDPVPTSREQVIDCYFATLTGTHGNGLIGPAIVTVVMTTHSARYRPSFSVQVNGRHQFGYCGPVQDADAIRRATTPSWVIRHDR